MLVYGLEVQQLSVHDLKRLDSVYTDMASRVIALRRDRQRPWLEWRIRSLREARDKINSSKTASMPSYRVGLAMWGVGVAAATGCLGGLLKNILMYRSLGWWYGDKKRNGAREGHPTHTRSGPRRRWEGALHRYSTAKFGRHWLQVLDNPSGAARDFACNILTV